MSYARYSYNRIYWENKSESLKTPLGKTNLNRMDEAIYNIAENLDIAYNAMQSQKLDISAANKMLRSTPVWDPDTGIFTLQFYDGTEFSIDFNVEKIPVSFSMDSAGVITMVTEDGTEWRADIGELIPDYSFEDSERVAFHKTKKGDGSYCVTADLIKGSITGEYLDPDYLADITAQASKAEASAASAAQSEADAGYDAKLAQSYSVGGSGVREGEDEDNSLYFKKLAESFAHGGMGIRQDEEVDNARYYKEEAEKSCAGAIESEEKAKASEESAAESATQAEKYEIVASSSADAAAQNACESAKSAMAANNSAKAASESAADADSSASSAKTSEDNAKSYSDESRSWAVGGTGTRVGEDTDNSRYYALQAKESAERAASLSNIDTATVQKAGIVKPDGETITVDEDGTIHGSAKVNVATEENTGVVKPDGETITVDEDGTLRASEKKLDRHVDSTLAGDDGVHGLRYSNSRFEVEDAEGNWAATPVIIPTVPSEIVGAVWLE